MTIATTARRAGPYTGNSSATVFAFAFKVFAASDLVVTLQTIATGAEVTLVLTTDYTVSLNADQNTNPGGSVTYNPSGVPIPSTKKLTITSAIPRTQGADGINAGGYYPEVVEAALDKGVALVQEVTDFLNRVLVAPVTESTLGALPPVATRKGKALIFNASTGAPEASVDAYNDQATAAAASAAAASASASAAGVSETNAAASAASFNAAWTAYTPTVISNDGTLSGTSISLARYKLMGKTVHLHVVFSTTVATGSPTQIGFYYPGTAVGQNNSAVGTITLKNNGGTMEMGTFNSTTGQAIVLERQNSAAFSGACLFFVQATLEIA